MELGYLSPIFLREKKVKKHRLILNLKERNKFVTNHNFKKDFKISTKYGKGKMFHGVN